MPFEPCLGTIITPMHRPKLFLCWSGLIFVGLSSVVRADDDVLTFFATSDSHYEAIEHVERNDRNRLTIERMNDLPGQPWPEKLGGGPIGKPRGVLALGDLIDDGDKNGQTDIEWKFFSEHFGLDGSDGLLKYPVFEGWGNHDGPPEKYIKQRVSVQTEIKRRNVDRLDKKRISRVSANGLHYSWDWNGVHFIQTNLYPADKQNAKVRYSLPWHDPQDALAFVQEDLAATVGVSGRPVIIMAHCGFDTDWWVVDDWKAFYDAVKPYNLLAYFHGHSGTGVRQWKPEGEERPLDVVNTGQTEKGFFVVEITKERMRLGFHVKRDPKVLKDIEWEWKYLFEKPLNGAKPVTTKAAEKPQDPAPAKKVSAAPVVGPTPASQVAASPGIAEGDFRFAVIGDFGLDDYKPKTAAKQAESKSDVKVEAVVNPKRLNPNEAAVAELVASWKPAFVVTTGDNNYPKGEAATIDENIGKYYADFIGHYRGRYGRGAAENRFFPVLGNHDWDAPKVRCQAYLDYFTLPGNERYYEFTHGPLHFFMLDNDGREPDGVRVGSKQYEWLVQAITASRLPFQIVVAHHPAYSSGEHGNTRDADWDFERLGVDLILNGHDHEYERIERDGLIYVVNGAGGGNLRHFESPVDGSLVRYYHKHGAMQIDVSTTADEATLTSRFIDVDGVEIDRFTLHRSISGKHPASDTKLRKVTAVPATIRQILGLVPFYQQYVDADGLAIVGSKQVTPEALLEAAYLVDRMLVGRDDLRRAIVDAKVRVTVMATGEFTTDVPEHADLKPKDYWNRRARGLGATTERPSVSCGEENLLLLSGDQYQGENILIHEFAHTIHEIGLAKTDPTFDARLRAAFDRAKERGLWKNAYALTNPQEYWAEGVQSWFDCNRSPDKVHNQIRTRDALKQYDPALAQLVAEVFGEQSWRYTTPRQRTDAIHLASVDWDKLPRFKWPAELRHATEQGRKPDAVPSAASEK